MAVLHHLEGPPGVAPEAAPEFPLRENRAPSCFSHSLGQSAREPHLILGLNAGAAVDEHLDHFSIALLRGPHEGRLTVLRGNVSEERKNLPRTMCWHHAASATRRSARALQSLRRSPRPARSTTRHCIVRRGGLSGRQRKATQPAQPHRLTSSLASRSAPQASRRPASSTFASNAAVMSTVCPPCVNTSAETQKPRPVKPGDTECAAGVASKAAPSQKAHRAAPLQRRARVQQPLDLARVPLLHSLQKVQPAWRKARCHGGHLPLRGVAECARTTTASAVPGG